MGMESFGSCEQFVLSRTRGEEGVDKKMMMQRVGKRRYSHSHAPCRIHHLILHVLFIWECRQRAGVRAFTLSNLVSHSRPPRTASPPPASIHESYFRRRRRVHLSSPCLLSKGLDDHDDESDDTRRQISSNEEPGDYYDPPLVYHHNPQRRRMLGIVLWWMASLRAMEWSGSSTVAHARGLVQFPLKEPLLNNYHLMRAGSSLLEEQDIYSTNPLFLTNREDALSPLGQEQVVNACQLLKSPTNHLLPTVVRFSLAACCVDTANVVARELRLGRDRVIAEYTYLDPRAVGKWDMLSRELVEPALWALDNDYAGPDGIAGRPPPNEDGTPHETLSDAAVRLRQLLSVLERLYSGDTILLIFPDGTGPALLSCLMAGIPLNRVHELEFRRGELRINVTPDSTRELWASKRDNAEYQETIARGRETLQKLQSTSPDTIVSKRDQQIESERLDLEREFQEKQKAQRIRNEEQERARNERNALVAEERRKRGSTTSEGSRPDPLLVGLAGALAVGGAAVAVIPSPNSSALKPDAASEERGEVPEKSPPTGLYATPVEIRRRVNGDQSGSFVSKTDEEIEVLSNAPPPPPPPPLLSPLEAAQRAMDEYMDRDDGAEDWLQSLADILEEPEDDGTD